MTAKYTIAELIGFQIDRLQELQRTAADDRRPHRATDHLIDGLDEVGRTLRRIGRG